MARTPEPSPAAKAGAGPTSTAAPSGGTARLVSPASFNFDTFDAQRTGEASVAEVLGRTHSRLVNWSGFPDAVVVGDLARAWEQRDATSWAFHLDPAARWQDREPLNGRAVTADDVAQDLQRRIALAAAESLPTAQRAGDVERILRVTAPDPVTVVVESSAPDPFLLDTLAGRFAVVQAPEAVERFSGTWAQQRPEEVVGSGAVRAQWIDDGVLRFAARAGGHVRPILDAIEVYQPTRDVSSFLAGREDEFLARDRRDAEAIRAASADVITEFDRFEGSPVLSTFSIAGPPWNDPSFALPSAPRSIGRSLRGGCLPGGPQRAGRSVRRRPSSRWTRSRWLASAATGRICQGRRGRENALERGRGTSAGDRRGGLPEHLRSVVQRVGDRDGDAERSARRPVSGVGRDVHDDFAEGCGWDVRERAVRVLVRMGRAVAVSRSNTGVRRSIRRTGERVRCCIEPEQPFGRALRCDADRSRCVGPTGAGSRRRRTAACRGVCGDPVVVAAQRAFPMAPADGRGGDAVLDAASRRAVIGRPHGRRRLRGLPNVTP